MPRRALDLTEFDPRAIEHLLSRVYACRTDDEDGCWLWRGATNGKYGRTSLRLRDGGFRYVNLHRFLAALTRPLAASDDGAHSCDVKLCVNPRHIRPMSHAENIREMWARVRIYSESDQRIFAANRDAWNERRLLTETCGKGHSMIDEANVYRSPRGRRQCRACRRVFAAAYRTRRRG